MIALALTRFQGALLTALAVMLVLVGAYTMGNRAARRSVEMKTQKRKIEAAEDRRDVEEEIRVMPDAELAERLRKWNRD